MYYYTWHFKLHSNINFKIFTLMCYMKYKAFNCMCILVCVLVCARVAFEYVQIKVC